MSAPILGFRELGLTLEQFSQFTDAEIIALSNARMEVERVAQDKRLDGIFTEEPITPEEQAEDDVAWTKQQAAEASENDARERREQARRTWLAVVAKAEQLCGLVPPGARGAAYALILEALLTGKTPEVMGSFKYPKVGGGPYDFVVGPANEFTEGWFPRGDVHLIGGPSGSNKTTFMIDVLETQLKSEKFLGHETFGLPYLVLMSDRGQFAHLRTANRMRFDADSIPIKFLPSLTGIPAVLAIKREIETHNVMPKIVFVEGGDMLTENASKMEIVTPFLDALQVLARHYHISIILSVGSPKTRKGEGYISKRDGIFGTIAWSRKTETIAVLQYPDGDDTDSRRTLSVLLRNGPAEKYVMKLENGRLVAVAATEGQTPAQPQMDWFKLQTDWFTSQDLQEGIKVHGATADRYIASAHAKGVLIMKPGPRGSAKLYKWNPTAAKDAPATPGAETPEPDVNF